MVCRSGLRAFPERAALERRATSTRSRSGAMRVHPRAIRKMRRLPVQWPEDGWQIKPDYIVEGPTYEVPAKGIVEWTWFVVPGGFTKDTWVTSIEVLPSQLAVTHHVCLSYVQHTPDIQHNVPMLPRASSSVMRKEMKSAAKGRDGGDGEAPDSRDPRRPLRPERRHGID